MLSYASLVNQCAHIKLRSINFQQHKYKLETGFLFGRSISKVRLWSIGEYEIIWPQKPTRIQFVIKILFIGFNSYVIIFFILEFRSNIQTKIHIIYGSNDYVAKAENIPILLEKINSSIVAVNKMNLYNHGNFMVGRLVQVIPPIILDVINQLNEVPSEESEEEVLV